MNKFILLLVIPFLSFGQGFGIGPQFSINPITEPEFIAEHPNVLYGFKIERKIKPDLGLSVGLQFGKLEKDESEYVPQYDGVAVLDPVTGVINIIGANDEYTLTNLSYSKTPLINFLFSYYIDSYISLDVGFYVRGISAWKQSEEWGEMTTFNVDAGGNISAVTTEGVIQSRSVISTDNKIMFNKYSQNPYVLQPGFNLGASFIWSNLYLSANCIIPFIGVEWTSSTASEITNFNSGINVNFLVSISYLFNII